MDEDRLGGLGRATLRTLTALDRAARPSTGRARYVTAVSQVMPGWVLACWPLTLILPGARGERGRVRAARAAPQAVGPWFSWLAAGVLAFASAWARRRLLALAGATPEPPAAPVAPDLYPLDGAAARVLARRGRAPWLGMVALAAPRAPASRALADPPAPGAAVAVVARAALSSTLALWVVNPFSALILTPALHLWTLAILVDPPPAAARAAADGGAAGCCCRLLWPSTRSSRLSLDPLSGRLVPVPPRHRRSRRAMPTLLSAGAGGGPGLGDSDRRRPASRASRARSRRRRSAGPRPMPARARSAARRVPAPLMRRHDPRSTSRAVDPISVTRRPAAMPAA